MKRKKVVIVGGGSNSWTPNIVKDMMLTDGLSDCQFVLYDINKKAADVILAYLNRLNQDLKTPATFVSTDNTAAAFRDADYFIITISTGGFKAMAHDLAIPEKYNIFHTVGDTSGPGGWARCIRNFDVFVNLARDINRYAPGAMVLNYTNPMTTLTKVLSMLCNGPVVGLCHGLFENFEFIKNVYGLESEDEISAQYAGINHFFFITQLMARGRDILADFRKRLGQRGKFSGLYPKKIIDAMGFHSDHELADELFRLTDAMPYLGDRHTSEFVPFAITSAKSLERYKLHRTTIKWRVDRFKLRDRKLRELSKAGSVIPEDRKKRSRETAADIISAHATGRPFIDVGNTANIGQITNLPAGTVVETAVRVDQNGFTPITYGALPPIVLGLVEPYTRVFDMNVQACMEGNVKLAMQALRLDPVCSHLSTDKVNEMGTRLLKAHKAFIPMFKL